MAQSSSSIHYEYEKVKRIVSQLNPERFKRVKVDELKMKLLDASITESKEMAKIEKSIRKEVNDKSIAEQLIMALKMQNQDEKKLSYIKLASSVLDEMKKSGQREGFIELRSLTLKVWREKLINLDMSTRILHVYNRDKMQHERELNLQTFNCVESGTKKEYFCFTLVKLNPKSTDERDYLFGSKLRDEYQYWFKKIKQCCAVGQVSDLQQYNRSDSPIQIQKISSFESPSTKKAENGVRKQSQNASQNPQGGQSNNVSERPSVQDQNSNQQDRSPEKKLQTSQEVQERPSLKEQNKVQVPQKQAQTTQQQTIKQKQVVTSVTLEREQEKIYQTPHLFLSLSTPEFLSQVESDADFETILNEDDYKISQSDKNKSHFKIQLKVKTDRETLFKYLTDETLIMQWNDQMSETKVLTFMKKENTAIVYSHYISAGLLYKSREFTFLRFVYPKKDRIYIFDKSIDYSTKGGLTIQKGEIEYWVWSIREDSNGYSILNCDLILRNGGFNNEDQDSQITLKYLGAFKRIQSVIEQKYEGATIYDLEYKIIEQYEQTQETSVASNGYQYGQDLEQELLEGQEGKSQQPLEEPQNTDQLRQTEDEEGEVKPLDDEFKNRAEVLEAMRGPNRLTSSLLDEDFLKLIESNKHWQIALQNPEIPFPRDPIENYNPAQLMNTPEEGHYVFKKDFRREANGSMIFINEEIIQTQKNVIGYLLKKLGSNIVQGKSLTQVSLPIDVFETRSNLERFAFSFLFAPTYLELAAKTNDPVQQMKYALVFLQTQSILYMCMLKPFNPILGETYQGYIKGSPIYMEQISHHPPIAAFQLKGRGYSFEGYLESAAKMNVNSVIGHNYGDIKIHFYNTKNTIVLMQPSGFLQGTAYGERSLNLDGKAYAYDIKSRLYGEIQYDPDKKGSFSFGKKKTTDDYFIGHIWKMKDSLIQKFQSKYSGGKLYKFPGINMKEDIEGSNLMEISGIWNQKLIYNGEVLLDLQNGPFPHILEHEKRALASDCRFREDLVVWKTKDLKRAQIMKEKLENIQRNDRKLREKYKKK